MPRTSARRKRRQKPIGFERLEERALLAVTLVVSDFEGRMDVFLAHESLGSEQAVVDLSSDLTPIFNAPPGWGSHSVFMGGDVDTDEPNNGTGYQFHFVKCEVAGQVLQNSSVRGPSGFKFEISSDADEFVGGVVKYKFFSRLVCTITGDGETPNGEAVLIDWSYSPWDGATATLEGLTQSDDEENVFIGSVGQTFTVMIATADWINDRAEGVTSKAWFTALEYRPPDFVIDARWDDGGLFSDPGVAISYRVSGTLPASPIIQLVWASPEVVAYQFIGERTGSVGGTWYSLRVPGSILTAPFHSGSLLVRLAPGQSQSASYTYDSDILSFRSSIDVEWQSLSENGQTPRGIAAKNLPYELVVNVTNRSPGGVGIPATELTVTEQRERGSAPTKDQIAGESRVTVSVPSLRGGESHGVILGSFSHNWEWIPDENPVEDILGTVDGMANAVKEFAVSATIDYQELVAKVKGLWAGVGTSLQVFDWLELSIRVVINPERRNTYSYALGSPAQITGEANTSVMIWVPQNREAALAAYAAAKAIADTQLGAAVTSFTAGAPLPAVLFWLVSCKGWLDLARVAYDSAKDPPDPAYTQPVQLEYGSFSGSDEPSVRDIASLFREISAYRHAGASSLNRADGAALAGSPYWQAHHLHAAARFSFEASRLESRLSSLGTLYPDPIRTVTADEILQFSQRVAAEGLPADLVSGLRAAGFSEIQVAGLTRGLAGINANSLAGRPSRHQAAQVSSIAVFLEGFDMLLQGTRLEVLELGARVQPIPSAVVAELDANEATIEASRRDVLTDNAHEAAVDRQFARLLELLAATKNLPVLEPYLQRAAADRVQLIARSIRPSDVAAHIDQAVTAGSADAGAAGAVKVELDRAANAFAAGSQDTAAVAATVAEVVASRRGNGIPVALADDITGWTASVSGKSRLAADSFVLEVGRSYDLDVLANDSTVAGRLVPGSLAIQDAAGLGSSVTVVDGKLRLNPTAAMAGRHTVRYSVFDDASYLRNSQAISLTVTTNGIFVSDGQITTDTTTRTGGYDLVKLGAGKLVLDRANTHSGGTVIGAGEVIVRNLAALGTGTVVVNPGAKLTLDVGPEAVALTDLEIEAGGLLDVGMGRVVLEAGSFDVATIRERIAAGFGSGSSGITSAAAAAVPGRVVGHAVDGNGNLVVGFAAAGDLDMNGIVDGNDAHALINSRLFDSGLPATWAEGDYDYNGVLDMDDVIAFVTGGMYDQRPYLSSTSGPTAQAQTASDTQADTIGKVTFEAGDVAISAAFSPVDSSNDEGMSGISTPSRNDPLMDAAFAMLSSQEQSSTNSVERKKMAFLIL